MSRMEQYPIVDTKDSDQVEIVGQPVNIKGVRDGLLVTFNGDPDADLLTRLQDELAQKQSFLQGSRIAVDLGERTWEQEQLTALQSLMAAHDLTLWAVLSDTEETRTAARELGLATRLPGSQTDLDGKNVPLRSFAPVAVDNGAADNGVHPDIIRSKRNGRTDSQRSNEQQADDRHDTPPTPALDLTNAFLLRETLRSGRFVYHEGHIVIMGDVNPGAQVVAGGHVIVWGRLRGMVHAGAHGDESAVICALELSPTQLRIAGQIAVPPDDGRRRQAPPEQAAVRDGQIVAEPWTVRH